MKIGVFDSGVGGITVLRELRVRFPDVEYVYLGDTANVPYGTKSSAQIEKLSTDCAKHLKEYGVDLVVVACNTASSLALPAIEKVLGKTPVFGVVEPGAEYAWTARTHGQPILILATRATIQSSAYRDALLKKAGTRSKAVEGLPSQAIELFDQPCPLLVPMIEEGWTEHAILKAVIHEYTAEYRNMPQPGVALLACTHYPWIQSQFEEALPGWRVLNSAIAVADHLEKSGKIKQRSRTHRPTRSKIEWVFTDPQAVPLFARNLLEKI